MRTTKFAALVAAVALLVVGAAFASFAGWVPEGDEWTYYNAKGEQVFEEWQQDNGSWFWLDESGLMAKDELVTYKDNFYYVDANGIMATNAWIKITDDAYDVNDDDVDYRWFYFGADGKAYKNAMKEAPTAAGTKSFIFNSNGEMLYNYVIKGIERADKYEMTTSWETWKDEPYNPDESCYWCGSADDGAVVMADWVSLKTGEDENGDDKNSWFWCQASGKIAKATSDNRKALTIKGVQYTFDECGKMISGWNTDSTTTKVNYYTDKESGARITKGWFQAYDQYKDYNDEIDEEEDSLNWYYAKKKAVLAQSEVVSVGGKWYAFDDECKMVSGLYDANIDEEKRFEINPVNGVCGDLSTSQFGDKFETRYIDGYALYYFNEEHDGTFGAMKTGTHKVTIDDEEYTLSFTSAKNFSNANHNGRAYNGIVGNYYYQNGQKVTFDADDNRYYVVPIGYRLKDSKKVTERLENLCDEDIERASTASYWYTYAAGVIADSKKTIAADEDYIVMTSSGSFCKTLTNKSDTDSYKLTVKDYRLESIENAN